jgi:hypothetical protein
MVNRKDDTIRIALQEFNYPRDVLEEALAVSVKAIDQKDPGGATEESQKKHRTNDRGTLELERAAADLKAGGFFTFEGIPSRLGIKGK